MLCSFEVSPQRFAAGSSLPPAQGRTFGDEEESGQREGQNLAFGLRALVVDDNPDITFLFAMMLEQEGYEVARAESGASALELARREQFDLVISDIGMTEMNGYELAEELRTLPQYARVPMIAVTGFTQYDDQQRALESGFNVHLKKPVNPVAFIELVERLLRSK